MTITYRSDDFCTPATMLGILHDCRFSGGLSASGQSAGFAANLFTRDTLRVLRDVMHLPQMRSFVRQMLCTLPQWQGVDNNEMTNESPDAMPHQIFRQIVGGIRMDDTVVELAEYWAGQWQVPMTDSALTGKQFVIYNSSDGVPLYLITLCEYIREYGDDILDDRFMHWPTGEVRTVYDAARRCVDFILRRIEAGEKAGHGLYGVPNTNPHQTSPSGVMRDGFDAYVTRSGRPADYASMVYVENQALVHEALIMASDWIFISTAEQTTSEWRYVANLLVRRTYEQLWLEDESFFAAGLDKYGVVDMIGSSAFELLDSMFFDFLDYADDLVGRLVTRLYSPEFMTPIGCRMTSTVHAAQEGDYVPYQGSSAVWGITNSIIERGLRRQRLPKLAHDLGFDRLISWFNAAEEAYECTFVDRHGRPILRPRHVQDTAPEPGQSILCPAEFGQANQAWSASGALRILTLEPDQLPDERFTWQHDLDETVSDTLERFPTIDARWDYDRPFHEPLLDIERGRVLRQWRRQQLAQAAASVTA